MNKWSVWFLIAVAAFVSALIVIALHYYRRAQKSSQRDWRRLLTRLTIVDRSSIAEVALDIIDESGQQRKDKGSAVLEPSEIWKLVGGLEGLEVLEANSAVLIDLAFYVQQWYPEALVVAEQLRLNAREIEWHVGRLKGAAETGNLQSAFAAYAQRATVTYYLMTKHVLELYGQVGFPRIADLQRAI